MEVCYHETVHAQPVLGGLAWSRENGRYSPTVKLMNKTAPAVLAVMFLATAMIAPPFSWAEETKPAWMIKAEKALVGTWENTNPKTQSIPKIEIEFDKDDALVIRFWGRTSPKDSPFGPPDPLLILSSHTDTELPKDFKEIAFATHKADFALKHFTLKLRDDTIHLEGVTIFSDSSGRSNRISTATFKKP